MYLAHWALARPPFPADLDPLRFFLGPVQEEALARLQFLVEQRRPAAFVAAPGGCGKSLLCEVFAEKLRSQGRAVVRLAVQGLDARELWWNLAAELGLNPRRDEREPTLWRAVSDRLAQHRSLQRDLVLLLDDLDGAEPSCAAGVLRLLSLNRRPESRVIAAATGRPETLSRLDPRLLEQAELRIELENFSEADLAAFLAFCLAHAGRTDSPFTNAAVGRLHALTDGNPRRASHLAELALIAAAGQGMAMVDTEIVDGAYQELRSPEPIRRAG